MTLRNLLWWAAFLVAGICAQQQAPGVDILVVALLIALQEKNLAQISLIVLVLILVQEGLGSLDFGSSLLWYALVIGLFFAGRWLFETENWLFILLLSVCLGAAHGGIFLLMARLQYAPVELAFLLDECILQALLTAVACKIAMVLRRWLVPHEN